MNFKTTGLVAVGLAGVALVACGAETSDPQPHRLAAASSEAPTKFIAKLDAICKAAEEDTAASGRKLDVARESGDSDAYVEALDEAIRIWDRQLAKAGALEPARERTFFKAYMESVGRTLDLMRSLRDAADRQDYAAVRTFYAEIKSVGERTDALVAGHGGFDHCGKR